MCVGREPGEPVKSVEVQPENIRSSVVWSCGEAEEVLGLLWVSSTAGETTTKEQQQTRLSLVHEEQQHTRTLEN